MKTQNIAIVVTVRAKNKHRAKEKIISLMNCATSELEANRQFPEWGFWNEYKLDGAKVKK